MQEIIVDNIDRVIQHFNLNLRMHGNGKCLSGMCPIHQGDNPGALAFYVYGHTTVGSWRCFTQGCHNTYGDNAIGFIRALLSIEAKEEVSFQRAIKWCEQFFNHKQVYTPKTDDDKLTDIINRYSRVHEIDTGIKLTKRQFLERLKTPPQYYLNRDYTPEILDKFSVGFCDNPAKPFYNRVVVPVYDVNDEFIISFMARSIYDKCETCRGYHNPKAMCVKYGKWQNSQNFPSESMLYNFGSAKPHIIKHGIVIVVEGAPNVWRLEEAGFPMSIASFGSKFTTLQKDLLDTTPTQNIIVVPDAGEPGKMLVNHIEEECKNTHNIIVIKPTYKDDIGACNIEVVKQIIGPVVEKRLC